MLSLTCLFPDLFLFDLHHEPFKVLEVRRYVFRREEATGKVMVLITDIAQVFFLPLGRCGSQHVSGDTVQDSVGRARFQLE